MAIQSISAIQRYIGLSTDTMPTAGVGSGAEFLQTDTGAIYIYTGSSWVIHTPAVQVSGSTAPVAGSVQAQKDIVAYAIDNIINDIGLNNLKLFLPLTEGAGASAYFDVLKKNISFAPVGNPIAVSTGPLGSAPVLDGATNYLAQVPLAQNPIPLPASVASWVPINTTTTQVAQRFIGTGEPIGPVQLAMKRAGTLPSATVEVQIFPDSSGSPGATHIGNGISEVNILASQISTTGGIYGVPFNPLTAVGKGVPYWIVVSYGATTGVDASDYIEIGFDGVGTYGNSATYASSAWTVSSATSMYFQMYDSTFSTYSNTTYNIPGDFTAIVAVKSLYNPAVTPTPSYILGLLGFDTTIYADAFYLSMANTGMVQTVVFDTSEELAAVSNDWPSVWTVYAVTFQYSASSNKINIYSNGIWRNTASGTASVPAIYPTTPLLIGALPTTTGVPTGLANIVQGPVIWAWSALSASAIADISKNILALCEYGVSF